MKFKIIFAGVFSLAWLCFPSVHEGASPYEDDASIVTLLQNLGDNSAVNLFSTSGRS